MQTIVSPISCLFRTTSLSHDQCLQTLKLQPVIFHILHLLCRNNLQYLFSIVHYAHNILRCFHSLIWLRYQGNLLLKKDGEFDQMMSVMIINMECGQLKQDPVQAQLICRKVADIKRINGLVSDVQMFAMKTLQIPSPGRHPPSAVQSSSFDAQGAGSSETTPSRRRHSDLFDTFQSLKLKSSSQQDVSPSMSRLRDNGSKMADQIPIPEGFEIVYQNGGTYYLQDGPLATPSIPKPPVGLHRKCKSEANGFMLGDSDDMSVQESGKGFIDEDDSDKLMKKLHVRRRQKSVADFSSLAPQMSAKEENSTEGNLSATVFKSLSLRPKSTNQLLSSEDSGAGQQSPMSIGLGESFIANIVNGIRKSSSTSSLQESDNGTLLSLWQTTKSCLKPDLNALSTAAITRPILDGIITNPICGRKNKAAVD